MTTREYLGQLLVCNRKIENIMAEIKRLEDMASSTAAPPLQKDKVQTSKQGDSLCNTVAKILDLQRGEYGCIVKERQLIVDQICNISNSDYSNLLYKRYAQGMKVIDIANKMNYTREHTSRMINKSMNAFESIYGYSYLKK